MSIEIAYPSLRSEIRLQPDCDCAPVFQFDEDIAQLPSNFSLEITPMCNSRCLGCSNVFIDDTKSRGIKSIGRTSLNGDEWIRLIQKSPHMLRESN